MDSQYHLNLLSEDWTDSWLSICSQVQAGSPTTAPSPPTGTAVALPFHGNRDIIDEIFSYLSVQPFRAPPAFDATSTNLITPEDNESHSRRQIRRKLCSLAVMCKAFMGPALDQLWRSLDSLFPLLKLLPAFKMSDGTWVSTSSCLHYCLRT